MAVPCLQSDGTSRIDSTEKENASVSVATQFHLPNQELPDPDTHPCLKHNRGEGPSVWEFRQGRGTYAYEISPGEFQDSQPGT